MDDLPSREKLLDDLKRIGFPKMTPKAVVPGVTSMMVCHGCGALVLERLHLEHARWHELMAHLVAGQDVIREQLEPDRG